MISLLQHQEGTPLSDLEAIQLFKDAMPLDMQLEFRRKHGAVFFEELVDVEAAFLAIEEDMRWIKAKTQTQSKNAGTHSSDESKPKSQKPSSKPQQTKSTPQKPKGKPKCSFCDSKGYKADNHTSEECGRRDNPKNTEEEKPASKSKHVKFTKKTKEDLAAIVNEIDDLTGFSYESSDDGAAMQEHAEAVAVENGCNTWSESNGKKMVLKIRVALLIGNEQQVVNGLLDTGSTTSTVDASYVPKHLCDLSQRSRFRKIDATIGETLGLAHIPFKPIDFSTTRVLTQPIKVVSSLVYPLVLGLDFLIDQGMVFDFDKRIIVWDEIQMNMATQDLAATSITTKQVILDANYDMPKLEDMVPDHLHPEEQLQLLQLIRRYHGVFEGRIGNIAMEPFVIPLKESAVPFAARPYPIPEIHLAAT
ncbi:hypothetical protein AeMF1_021330, partial [Aphanomyces euteiches]